MDRFLTILLIFVNLGFTSQATKIPLLGKWQLMEYEHSDGAKDYRTKIKDGQVFVFRQKNIVTDNLGNTGKYETNGNKLKITILKKSQFFIFQFRDNDHHKLYLTPVTDKYGISCDEGCAYVYNKK